MRMKDSDIREVSEQVRYERPATRRDIENYINFFLGVDLPHVVVSSHQEALDYIWYAFNVDFLSSIDSSPNGDCVVWASRGGGKTQLAGILTLLDCIFKPNIQIRILSGSGYQAGRMYDYFRKYLRMGYEDLVKEYVKSPTDKVVFKNYATVEVLKQSETSVRGSHVHKLRCDEVELFKPKVFEAAQYTTMSSDGYVAALELVSTQHRPHGLMAKLIKASEKLNRPVFKWNLWDVIERCRRPSCDNCKLEPYCKGKARNSNGYYRIDDAITQLERTKPHSFVLEMLCGEGTKKKGLGWIFKSRNY